MAMLLREILAAVQVAHPQAAVAAACTDVPQDPHWFRSGLNPARLQKNAFPHWWQVVIASQIHAPTHNPRATNPQLLPGSGPTGHITRAVAARASTIIFPASRRRRTTGCGWYSDFEDTEQLLIEKRASENHARHGGVADQPAHVHQPGHERCRRLRRVDLREHVSAVNGAGQG